MAKYDQGGGCACGLYKQCECDKEDRQMMTNTKKRYICFPLDGGYKITELTATVMQVLEEGGTAYEIGNQVFLKKTLVPTTGVTTRG